MPAVRRLRAVDLGLDGLRPRLDRSGPPVTKKRPESFDDFELDELKAAVRVFKFMTGRLTAKIRYIEDHPGEPEW